MTPLEIALLGTGTMVGSAVLALLSARLPRLSTGLAAWGAVLGGVAALVGALTALRAGSADAISGPWPVPAGALALGLDPLSAFFLLPLSVLGALSAWYGRGYLGPRPIAAAKLNLLLAAMILVLLARHALVFLVAWEVMTLFAYVLVTLDHVDGEVRRAGWVYLIASHVTMLALFALFLALGTRAGGALDFASFQETSRAPGATGILLLALVGFGIKAGVLGLHVWLPEAHAAAPSHVSALMSGVLIKLGLYGLLRIASFVPPTAWFGVVLMFLGIFGALVGIVLASVQRDLKRVLAYSSVENVGIILVGLGLGLWARTRSDTRLAALGFSGGFLHLWNHTAMKGLLFLGAGSVLHGTGSKDMERLGGLLRRMPWTGLAMIGGSVAIAGLPPLCGFAGEWLLYRGLAQVGLHGNAPSCLAAIGGAAALALVGGLAALCFVRLTGVVLLGEPRSDGAARAHESPLSMTVPLGILAAACLAGPLAAPALVALLAPLLERMDAATAADVAATSGELRPLVFASLGLLILAALAFAGLALRVRRAERTETWGCGYAAPTARMQYSGRAFSELLSSRVLPRWLRARLLAKVPEGPFPTAAAFASDTVDPLTRGVYEPVFAQTGDRFARLRFLQQGNVHLYLLYIVAAMIVALGWMAVRDWLAVW